MSDLADFTSPVDLALQSITELTVRTKLGTPVWSRSSHSSIGTNWHPVASVDGKGYLYAAMMKFNWGVGADAGDVGIRLLVDWTEMIAFALSTFRDEYKIEPCSLPGWLSYIDETTRVAVWRAEEGITWDENFELQTTNNAAGTSLTVLTDMYYTTI